MSKIFFSFTEKDARELARELFIKAVRFDFSKDKHRRMFAEAENVLADGIHAIDIRGHYEILPPSAFQQGSVKLGDRTVNAVAFSQYPDESVKNVIPYIISGGECACRNEDDIADLLFAHMWGTAYVDAGRLLFERGLRERIESVSGIYLSPAFSPGFYGMGHDSSREIADALSAGEIGIEVLESGTMLPIKTVSGIYLAADNAVDYPTNECLNCIGNRENCSQCFVGNRRRGRDG